MSGPQRAAALLERLSECPRCPVARYLLACQAFDQGRLATGVRQMMIAHHAEAQFESAALLVFAGLNLIASRGASLLPALLDTWEEFRRPDFDRRPAERALLDAFADEEPAPAFASPLARRLWRLPILTLRAQIREAVRNRDVAHYAQLLASA